MPFVKFVMELESNHQLVNVQKLIMKSMKMNHVNFVTQNVMDVLNLKKTVEDVLETESIHLLVIVHIQLVSMMLLIISIMIICVQNVHANVTPVLTNPQTVKSVLVSENKLHNVTVHPDIGQKQHSPMMTNSVLIKSELMMELVNHVHIGVKNVVTLIHVSLVQKFLIENYLSIVLVKLDIGMMNLLSVNLVEMNV
jgi:hypothetical protein